MRNRRKTHRYDRRLLTFASVAFAVVSICFVSVEGTATDVMYLQTKVTRSSEELLVGHGAFEISGPPHRWYGVYFQVRLDADTALRLESEKEDKYLIKHWGDIFTPENVVTARYTDCRAGIPVKEIASAANFPKGKRTALWVVCDVWDVETKKYIGSGWSVRAPLIVTRDKAGKIIGIETFNTDPINPKKNHYSRRSMSRNARFPSSI